VKTQYENAKDKYAQMCRHANAILAVQLHHASAAAPAAAAGFGLQLCKYHNCKQ
jgi:hypothetical protein